MGYFLDDLRAFGINIRHVDDCNSGRGGMAQDGGTRSGTFHGEIDRCRESQGWTTACSRMPERDGKDQGQESKRARAGSLAIVDKSQVARTCILRAFFWCADAVLPFSCVTFVLFLLCFLFVFLISLKPQRSVLRYACAPTATRSYLTTVCALFFLFPFTFLWRSRFFRVTIHCRFLIVWRVRRTFFFPSGW